MKGTTSYWLREARSTIAAALEKLPPEASPEEKLAAIDAAYPFGPRQYDPYKQWLKARREYLAGFNPRLPPAEMEAWRNKMRAQGYRFAGDEE